MMALPHRFDSEALLLKRWIEDGHLGTVHHVRAGMVRRDACPSGWFTDRERSGGGATMQLGSYLLDLTFWLLEGPEVRRVSASCFKWREAQEGPTRSLAHPRARGEPHDVEDSAVVLLRMSGHRTAAIEAAWSLHCEGDRQYLEVYGDRGGATLWPLRMHRNMDGIPVDVVPRHEADQSYKLMARHFVDCVMNRDRCQPIGSAQDGVRLARVMSAIYESAGSDREVEVSGLPVIPQGGRSALG